MAGSSALALAPDVVDAVVDGEDVAAELGVVFAGDDGVGERRERLADCWRERFEDASPVRRAASFRGQRNFPGWWWAATSGRHVGFESWLERDHLMLLDFDRQVVGFASQPFWIEWPDPQSPGRVRRHAPDVFARRADGTGVVIDVRPDERIKPADAQAFAVTAAGCRAVGWRYVRIGEPPPVLTANVRWLAGYRHRRCLRPDLVEQLRDAFAVPRPVWDGATAVGDPVAVLPVLFHLLWRGLLVTDLSGRRLDASTAVVCAAAAIPDGEPR